MALPSAYIIRFLCLLIVSIGLLIGRMFVQERENREERRLANEARAQAQAASRSIRRRKLRETGLREDQLCIVCCENPREMILLPCGHVCLCEDCSDNIHTDCPACRAPIVQKHAAYII